MVTMMRYLTLIHHQIEPYNKSIATILFKIFTKNKNAANKAAYYTHSSCYINILTYKKMLQRFVQFTSQLYQQPKRWKWKVVHQI